MIRHFNGMRSPAALYACGTALVCLAAAAAARYRRCAVALSVVWIAAVVMPAATVCAQSGAPDPAVTKLQDFYAVLLHTMKQADQLKLKGRYEKLSPAVEATFDLPAMTRIAVGPSWSSIPAGERDQLVTQFSRMTIANYAKRFDGYNGERFEVDPETVEKNGNRIVRSRLILPQRDPVPLNYLFHQTGAAWKAIDVYLNGTISELATRRSEFGALLKTQGAAALAQNLKQRTDALMNE